MSPLSRRGFLLTAPSALTASPTAAAAAAAERSGPPAEADPTPTDCVPNTAAPGTMEAAGKLGTLAATALVDELKDVVALRYHLTNLGDTQTTYTVSSTDLVTGFASRPSDVTVNPGQVGHGVLYGGLEHQFQLSVDVPDAGTLSLGPLNHPPACRISGRKPPKPIYQGAHPGSATG